MVPLHQQQPQQQQPPQQQQQLVAGGYGSPISGAPYGNGGGVEGLALTNGGSNTAGVGGLGGGAGLMGAPPAVDGYGGGGLEPGMPAAAAADAGAVGVPAEMKAQVASWLRALTVSDKGILFEGGPIKVRLSSRLLECS